MSPFHVDWPNQVRAQLAEIWINAPNRNAVTAAQATIDRILAADPIGQSQHLSEGLYKFCASPLTVYHSIDYIERKVTVEKVVHDPQGYPS